MSLNEPHLGQLAYESHRSTCHTIIYPVALRIKQRGCLFDNLAVCLRLAYAFGEIGGVGVYLVHGELERRAREKHTGANILFTIVQNLSGRDVLMALARRKFSSVTKDPP